jgi:hypothetical protein
MGIFGKLKAGFDTAIGGPMKAMLEKFTTPLKTIKQRNYIVGFYTF